MDHLIEDLQTYSWVWDWQWEWKNFDKKRGCR